MNGINIVGWATLASLVLTNFAILVRMNVKTSDLIIWQAKVDIHLADTQKHLDPHRDETRWQDLIKRMDRFEKKLDNLLAVESSFNAKIKRGDSDDA